MHVCSYHVLLVLAKNPKFPRVIKRDGEVTTVPPQVGCKVKTLENRKVKALT